VEEEMNYFAKKHNNRAFDKTAYEMNDLKGKLALLRYLKKQHFIKIDYSENCDVDMTAYKNGIFYWFEVEIKKQWHMDWNEEWKHIRIPERKKRLIDKYNLFDKTNYHYTNRFFFVVFNKHLNFAWFISAQHVSESKVSTIQNSKKENSLHLYEPFFHIEKSKAKLIEIDKNIIY
jgi:hypothetical protein